MFKYHSTIPDSNKSYFTELDTVDMTLKYPGRKIVANSIRVSGKLQLWNGPAQVVDPANTDNVFFDGMVGAHSFFNNWVTSSDNLGVIELLNNYPRWVKSKATGTLDEDALFNSSKVCELRVARDYDTHALMIGEMSSAFDGNAPVTRQNDIDFYIKPDIALNNCSGDLSYSKFNNIKVSFRLARNVNALFGSATNAGTMTYRITDLKLHFRSVPDNGPEPVTFSIKYSISQGISTGASVIQVKAPIECDSVAVNFIAEQDDSSRTANNYKLEDLPLLDEVEYEYNNATNSLISFNMRNREELNYFTEMGMKSMGVDNMSLDKLEINKSFLIAYGFPSQSLLNSKITINVKSGITANYIAYVFLHGYIQI